MEEGNITAEGNDLHKNCHSADILENVPTFLSKTYEILENQDYSDIISWTRNGEGFIVKKVKDFSEKILPLHFRHSNYSSFVRQLNMYDFHKMRQDNQENAFKNTLFKKGQKHLLREIQRKDYKKNKDMRLQLSFRHDDLHRKKKTNNDNILEKELDIELQSGKLFQSSYSETNKTMKEMLELQEHLLGGIEAQLNRPSGETSYDDIVDTIIRLKIINSKYGGTFENSTNRLSNFLFAKYLKWSSLSFDEKSSSKAVCKSTEFPSWANIICSSTFIPSAKMPTDF